MEPQKVQWTGIWFVLVVGVYLAFSFLWPADAAVNWNISFFIQMIIVQVGILLLPALGLRQVMKMPELRWNATLRNGLQVAGMAIGVSMTLILLNLLWLSILQLLGWNTTVADYPPVDSWSGWLLGMIFIALMPALIEEIVFRGTLQTALRPLGERRAIWWTAALFALLHLDIQGLPGRLLLGLLMGYLACTSASLGLSTVYHFLNNAGSVTMLALSTLYLKWFESMMSQNPALPEMTDAAAMLPTGQLLLTALILLPLSLGGLLLCWCCMQFYRRGINPARDPLGSWGREFAKNLLPNGRYTGIIEAELPVLGKPYPMALPLVWPLWMSGIMMAAVYVWMWIR